jgi:hypothetical protein
MMISPQDNAILQFSRVAGAQARLREANAAAVGMRKRLQEARRAQSLAQWQADRYRTRAIAGWIVAGVLMGIMLLQPLIAGLKMWG